MHKNVKNIITKFNNMRDKFKAREILEHFSNDIFLKILVHLHIYFIKNK
jgi:hypothetical protein